MRFGGKYLAPVLIPHVLKGVLYPSGQAFQKTTSILLQIRNKFSYTGRLMFEYWTHVVDRFSERGSCLDHLLLFRGEKIVMMYRLATTGSCL
jgi:hypothetical protein